MIELAFPVEHDKKCVYLTSEHPPTNCRYRYCNRRPDFLVFCQFHADFQLCSAHNLVSFSSRFLSVLLHVPDHNFVLFSPHLVSQNNRASPSRVPEKTLCQIIFLVLFRNIRKLNDVCCEYQVVKATTQCPGQFPFLRLPELAIIPFKSYISPEFLERSLRRDSRFCLGPVPSAQRSLGLPHAHPD